MIAVLTSSYTGPSSDKIGGKVVVQKELAEHSWDNSTITLTTDGWSSVHNDPVNAINIHTGCNCYIPETTDYEAENKTAEACAKR